MVEYFHIYVNGGLTYVGLVLSQAVQVMDKLKADGNKPVMKSYMLDPAVLEAMSQSYDDERYGAKNEIVKQFAEKQGLDVHEIKM
jgi:hypothetical protein